MAQDGFESQMRRLVTGLADQEIKAGREFVYDGGALHADDVAEIGMPSILCIAQDLSKRLGTGDFGYRFQMGEVNPVFPLHAIRERPTARFFEVAPFVTEVFEGEVLDCRHDLARLFEVAAKLVRPEFNLESNTNHRAATIAANAEETSAPSLER